MLTQGGCSCDLKLEGWLVVIILILVRKNRAPPSPDGHISPLRRTGKACLTERAPWLSGVSVRGLHPMLRHRAPAGDRPANEQVRGRCCHPCSLCAWQPPALGATRQTCRNRCALCCRATRSPFTGRPARRTRTARRTRAARHIVARLIRCRSRSRCRGPSECQDPAARMRTTRRVPLSAQLGSGNARL